MSRYTGPAFKKSRRLGFSTLESGKELRKRTSAPGQHGTSRKKLSEYGIQLAEKQKVRIMYGLTEKQFKKTFLAAGKKQGIHGTNLLIMLESRLDNLVYRMGFAASRDMARQLVNHGHFTVNGKNVDIPSILVKAGDVVAVRETKKDKELWKAAKEIKNPSVPGWLEYDNTTLTGKVLALPERADIDLDVKEHLIVELYSK